MPVLAEVTVVLTVELVRAHEVAVVLMDEVEAVLGNNVAVVLMEDVNILAVVALNKGARKQARTGRGTGLNLDGVVGPLRHQPD
jgi:hypothetical protein